MFALSELTALPEWQGGCYKLLKPWWEVFMEYLVVLMLMVSVLAGTLLLSRDGVVCLPVDPHHAPSLNHSSPHLPESMPPHHQPSPESRQGPLPANQDRNHASRPPPPPPVPQTAAAPPHQAPPPRGRRTHLDYQQYVYVAQVCYHEALPWYSRFFPYLALLQSLVLLASGCFWFRFPRTSARIEHFLVILGKCCESPWTSRALSLAARLDGARGWAEEGGGTVGVVAGGAGPKPPPPPPPSSSTPASRSPSIAGRSSLDSGTDSPLLVRSGSASASAHVTPPSPCPSALSRSSSLSSGSFSPSSPSPCAPQHAPPARDAPPQASSLDRSDGEQARALFERVRRFRAHCESSDIIYKVYLAQTVFKVLKFVLIVSYTVPLLGSISFSHVCEPQAHALTGYSAFLCTHSLASTLRKLLLAYLGLLVLFGLLGLYTLCWICHRSLRQYSFQRVRDLGSLQDVPDLCNDLAFLLHMADQYDPLLSRRLSVFLSPVSETQLLEESLERRWDAARLRAAVTSDPHGHAQLQLVALPRLPHALFSLSHLEVLKLELIANAKLPAQVSHMTSLRELHLYHCPAAVEPGALAVLQERLEALHLTFTQAAEIPSWVYALRGLQELHLTGRVGGEGGAGGGAGGRAGGGAGRGWALGSLRQLRHLRTLVLRGALLQRVPGELAEVAGSLLRLEVHNEGARLLALTGLRRLAGLAELSLQGCQLESLPSALLALGGLRGLDLRHNALRTLEGLLGLQHLRRLACLQLAHNRVLALPASVGMLRALELLDLSHNRLQTLPPALFTLPRLRCLLLAANLLEDLPAEVAALTQLAELDLSANKLESLPPALPARLRTLDLAHNSLGGLPAGLGALGELSRLDVRGNSLEALPAELGACAGLRGGGLLAEDWLLLSLPAHVRESLRQPDSAAGAAAATATDARSRPNSRPNSDSPPSTTRELHRSGVR
ncbi:volume-regulated anion channel subunit LRRC8D [Anguilla rostrata]|uniref:volume-regulated anion channel subunit LRRC8D n=1 Tax=Anguilla rostrata TaxID=7938 RepID=UPI0030D51792